MSNADRSIQGSFNGTQFNGHNTNIQSDNNVSNVNIGDKFPEDVFGQLRKEIAEMLTDQTDRDQALEFAQNLESAVESNDLPTADKYTKWLDRIIHGSKALSSIVDTIQSF